MFTPTWARTPEMTAGRPRRSAGSGAEAPVGGPEGAWERAQTDRPGGRQGLESRGRRKESTGSGDRGFRGRDSGGGGSWNNRPSTQGDKRAATDRAGSDRSRAEAFSGRGLAVSKNDRGSQGNGSAGRTQGGKGRQGSGFAGRPQGGKGRQGSRSTGRPQGGSRGKR